MSEQSVRVRVPATSANLGPGFDALGIACTLYNEMTLTLTHEPGLHISARGEGAAFIPSDERNIVWKSIQYLLQRADRADEFQGAKIRMSNRIPLSRGLGSSATAIVAGLTAANALVGSPFHRDDLLQLATDIEGHPDNVAPAVFGGATVAWVEADGTPRAAPMPVDGTLPVSLLVPPSTTRLSTEEARKVLPDSVPRADALFNTSRAAVLMLALAGRPDLLLAGTEDRLHQEYRRSVLPSSMAVMDSLRGQGYPAVISGAGPTVLVLADVAQQTRFTLERHGWTVLRPGIDTRGAVLTSAAS